MKFKKLMEILFYELVYQFSYACKIKKKKNYFHIKIFLHVLGGKNAHEFISGSRQIYFKLRTFDIIWTYAIVDVNEFLKNC